MIDFFPVRCDDTAYSEYTDLFAACFPAAHKYNRSYLDWLYRGNPDGQVVGFDARDGDRLAAHYVCIPARAQVGDQEVRVLLSLNTATHPGYQGKGLFTQLAERTYAAGAAAGYDCVYGVANANSTPGFMRKLKFQLVGPLQARVGAGTLGIDFGRLDGVQFRRSWSANALAWRCSSPINPVTMSKKDGQNTFLTPALFGSTVLATAEIDEASIADALVETTGSFNSPFRLFIGMIPPIAQRRSLYIDIPHALRPSPLNFIYRSLSERVTALESNTVFFNFLDFDAY